MSGLASVMGPAEEAGVEEKEQPAPLEEDVDSAAKAEEAEVEPPDDAAAAGTEELELPAAYSLEKTSQTVRAVLQGTATCAEGPWVFAGRWHLRFQDTVTSAFEWRSTSCSASPDRPCAGRYEGYFDMHLPAGKERFKESELQLSFTENAAGGFNVEGDGKNDFGQFGIRGVVHPDNSIEFLKLASGSVPAGGKGTVPHINWVQTALDLLRYTAGVPQSVWFRKPVPTTMRCNRGDEVIWYSEIIKRPMDFQTLRDNLKGSQYASLDDFVEAARLIFTNAWTFNRPGDQCYIDADVVYLRFERKLASLFNRPLAPGVEEVEQRTEKRTGVPGGPGGKRKRKAEEQPPPPEGQPARRAAAVKAKRELADAMHPEQKVAKGAEGEESLNDELHEARMQIEQLQEQLRAKNHQESQKTARPAGRGGGRGGRKAPSEKAQAAPKGRGRGGRRGAAAAAAAPEAVVKGEDFPAPAVKSEDVVLPVAPTVAVGEVGPLTDDEKDALQKKLDLLTEEQIEQVIEFLPTAIENGDEKEVPLEIDSLPPPRQHALVDFVEALLRKAGS